MTEPAEDLIARLDLVLADIETQWPSGSWASTVRDCRDALKEAARTRPHRPLEDAIAEYRAAIQAAPFHGEAGFIDDFQRRWRRINVASAAVLNALAESPGGVASPDPAGKPAQKE